MKKILIPAFVLALAVFLLLAIRGHWDTWKSEAVLQKTEDAYVAADQIPLSARITGTVRRVDVGDYQAVKAGQLILELEDADYKATTDEAAAAIDAIKAQLVSNQSAIARYSYQSGVPLLEHNFGTFGGEVSYTLFDGGARQANLRGARIKLSMAQKQLAQAENDARIQISAACDKVEQLQMLLKVSELTLAVREENYRVEVQRQQVSAVLESVVANAHAAATAARADVLSSRLNLYLAEDDIRRQMGEMPR